MKFMTIDRVTVQERFNGDVEIVSPSATVRKDAAGNNIRFPSGDTGTVIIPKAKRKEMADLLLNEA